MKLKQTLLTLALGFGLGFSLSLTSCSDNDLNNGGGDGNNGSNTELTDKEWEKQISLQRLMGALASVDSLPDNWNSDKYIVSEPTIGQAADEATASSVRLVATTSVDEAYREYCSYVGKSNSGSATTDTWQMDGIGSLTFTPNNQTDLYATVKVNIQQLPTLQEIRFVPASVIGNNDGNNDAYYSFGDIVKEGEGDAAVYWVCVCPVNKALGISKSHWCTLQLADENFKAVQNTLTLPTKLGKDQAKSQLMVENFFNLMRVMGNPENFGHLGKFNSVSFEGFTKLDANILSYMWHDNLCWKLVAPAYYTNNLEYGEEPTEFINRFMGEENENEDADQGVVNALYYGYTGKYNLFSSNVYRVYNLKLEPKKDYGLQFSSTPETPIVEWNKSDNKNFSLIIDLPKSYTYKSLMGDAYDNVFIVKDRTGAQLQGRFFSSSDDYKYTESFETSASGKGFTDVLVYKNDVNVSANIYNTSDDFYPFFSFGDIETKATSEQTDYAPGEVRVCVKPANNAAVLKNKLRNDWAYFLSTNTEPAADKGDLIELKDAQYYAFQLLRAFYYEGKGNWLAPSAPSSSFDEKSFKNTDAKILSVIYKYFKDNKAIKYNNPGGMDDYVSISVNFYMVGSNVKEINLKYYPYGNEPKCVYSVRDTESDDFIPVYHYSDQIRYYENYGGAHILNSSGTARTYYKLNCQKFYDEFVEQITE